MRRQLLEDLVRARRDKKSVAVITELASGRQALVDGSTASGDLPLTPAQSRAARDALAAERSGILTGHDGIFVTVFLPPLRLCVIGAVHIAQVLIPMAQLAGYEVVLIDPRRAWATARRFPGLVLDLDWPDTALGRLAPDRRTAVVALTHDPKLDDPALRTALETEAYYIGALGSQKTHAERLKRLAEAGVSDRQLARIHGPIGLAIGSRSPAEIAISILAQMTQVRRRPVNDRLT